MAQAPAGARQVPGVYRGPDNRPFAVNVDAREGALDRMRADGLRGHGAAIGRGRVASGRKAGSADRVAAELLAVRPGPHDCYTGCRIGSRARVTVHDQLRSLLLSVRRRWRAEAVLRAVGRGCRARRRARAGGCRPGRVARARRWRADGAGVHDGPGCAGSRGRRPHGGLAARRRNRQIARFVEERVATRTDVAPFDDVLVSAVDAVAPPESESIFAASSWKSAVRRLEAIGAAGIVTARALRRAGAEAVAGVAVLAVSVALAWPMLARASEAAWITVFPQSIQVEVLPGDTRVPAGQPLTIRASVRAGRNAAHALHAAPDRRSRAGRAHGRDDAGRRRLSVLVRVDRPHVPIPGDRRLDALGRTTPSRRSSARA